jgi:hypothetical protein
MMRHSLLTSAALIVLTLGACSDPAPQPAPTPAPEAVPTAPAPVPGATPAPETPVDQSTTPETPVPAPVPSEGEQGGTDQWRKVASADDADRLSRLDAAWRQALKEADVKFGAQIDAQGMLLVQKAGLAGPNLQPGPGTYRCRTLKVGSMSGDGLAYVEYPFFKCTVEITPGGDLILTKVGGSQRTRGLLYPGNDQRLVYLGAQAWGADEKGYPTYGQMPERDQIGVLERIGETRWRLALPFPKQEAKLEILDIRK